MLVMGSVTRGLKISYFIRTLSYGARVASKFSEQNHEGSGYHKKEKGSLIAAAFESLKNEEIIDAQSSVTSNAGIDTKIANANTVNQLLAISERHLTRKHALKIVSILAEWSSVNRVKISEFENDSRFIKVCRVLGRSVSKNNANNENKTKKNVGFQTDDLNTVLGIAGDDEAAKLIASISMTQMVKVLSTLAHRKRRSTPLLRSLAFNISSCVEQLDLKQCADILYAMASLNYQDSVLVAKICSDIQAALPKNVDKSAVVGSILTSLGLLKYRDLDVLESLTQWTLKNSEICRHQDIIALFLSLATLNFTIENTDQIKKVLVKALVKDDFQQQSDWLNYIWALSLLGLAENSHLMSVLNVDFLHKLEDESNGLSPNTKMKLLNINSYSTLIAKAYDGPVLDQNNSIFSTQIAYSKSKQVLVNSMLDALKSLLPSGNHIQTLINTKMGFLIDAICYFDARRNPLPMDEEPKEENKIAFMVLDFHDICHGTHSSVSGLINFYFKLLAKRGYKIVPIPYNEFNKSEKLLKRVQYLDTKIKHIIN